MAKKSRATFQKREKERARQQKQHDKAQRRVAAKAQRGSSAPPMALSPSMVKTGIGSFAMANLRLSSAS